DIPCCPHTLSRNILTHRWHMPKILSNFWKQRLETQSDLAGRVLLLKVS
ncbi:hypothetical protein IRJ41_019702, partial [Triplophysa rosa]